MSGLRDASEQRFETAANQTELVGELAIGRFEGVDALLKTTVFRRGSGVVVHQPRLFGGVVADQLFELVFE